MYRQALPVRSWPYRLISTAAATGVQICLDGLDCFSAGADGYFSLVLPDAEPHTLTADFIHHLAAETVVACGESGMSIGTTILRAGDLNEDGKINILDLVMVGGNFGLTEPINWSSTYTSSTSTPTPTFTPSPTSTPGIPGPTLTPTPTSTPGIPGPTPTPTPTFTPGIPPPPPTPTPTITPTPSVPTSTPEPPTPTLLGAPTTALSRPALVREGLTSLDDASFPLNARQQDA